MHSVSEFKQSSEWARTISAPAFWGHHSMDTNPYGNTKEGGNFENTNWQRKAGHFEYGTPAEEMTTADTDTDAASYQRTWSACTSTSPSESGPNDATDIEEGGFAQAVTRQHVLSSPLLMHCEHAETADEFDQRPMIMRGTSTPAQFGTDHAMNIQKGGLFQPEPWKRVVTGTLPSAATIPGFADLYDQHVGSDDEFDQGPLWARTHHQPLWAQPME